MEEIQEMRALTGLPHSPDSAPSAEEPSTPVLPRPWQQPIEARKFLIQEHQRSVIYGRQAGVWRLPLSDGLRM